MTRKLLLQKICPNACINDCRFIGCSQCNEKLNELLDDYDKHVIEQYKADTNLKDIIREIHDNVAQEMYCKGVEHFAFLMKEALNHDWATTKISEQIIYNRLYDECDRIAEELKAGGKNV